MENNESGEKTKGLEWTQITSPHGQQIKYENMKKAIV